MNNSLFAEKYYDDEFEEENLYPWEHVTKSGYGFVCVKNPHYMADGDEREFFVRKPTPAERKDIIVNTIIECNGRTFRIPMLAKKLGVSDRTVQMVLRELEHEGLIEIVPMKTQLGAQKGNAYRYIGPPCKKYGSGLTLQLLYDPKQNVGIRDWNWRRYAFAHDKVWHNNYPLCEAKFEQRKARREHLLKNNLPLIVPEDIKYLVLRHCYWKGNRRKLNNNFLFSKDGTVKFALFPLGRTETMTLFGHTMSIIFGGEMQNPQVTICDADGQQLGIFTWFDENIIQSETELDSRCVEQFFIIGDFTTK